MEIVNKALVLARQVLEGEQRLAIAKAAGSDGSRILEELNQIRSALEASLSAMSSVERGAYNEKLAGVRSIVGQK